MRYEVTVTRSSVYEVDADDREEAIDTVLLDEPPEVGGTTLSVEVDELETYGCDVCCASFVEEDMYVKEGYDRCTPGFAPEAVPAICTNCQSGGRPST